MKKIFHNITILFLYVLSNANSVRIGLFEKQFKNLTDPKFFNKSVNKLQTNFKIK